MNELPVCLSCRCQIDKCDCLVRVWRKEDSHRSESNCETLDNVLDYYNIVEVVYVREDDEEYLMMRGEE